MVTERVLKERVGIFKDVIMFLGGMTGIGFQQYLSIKGHAPNLLFLGIFTLMTGIPGATNLIGLFRSQLRTESLQSSSRQLESASESESS